MGQRLDLFNLNSNFVKEVKVSVDDDLGGTPMPTKFSWRQIKPSPFSHITTSNVKETPPYLSGGLGMWVGCLTFTVCKTKVFAWTVEC